MKQLIILALLCGLGFGVHAQATGSDTTRKRTKTVTHTKTMKHTSAHKAKSTRPYGMEKSKTNKRRVTTDTSGKDTTRTMHQGAHMHKTTGDKPMKTKRSTNTKSGTGTSSGTGGGTNGGQ